MIKHFINLTNGLEAIEKYHLSISELNFMYIASTTLENKSYIKLFLDLDHNFLFNLAIGNTIVFYDFGTKRKLSKTCYFGIPFIKYCLTRFWLGKDDKSLCVRYSRNGEEKFLEVERFNYLYNYLFVFDKNKEKTAMITKLKKYKNKFLLTNEIDLQFVSSSTNNDGNYEYYKNIAKSLTVNSINDK